MTPRTASPDRVIKAIRELIADQADAERFDRFLQSARLELEEVARRDADVAFVVFVLFGLDPDQFRPFAAVPLPTALLNRTQKTAIARGVRVLLALGPRWLQQAAGITQKSEARHLYRILKSLLRRLVRGELQSLGAAIELERPLTVRDREQFLTATIVCLMRQFEGHSKPAALAATLLEKADRIGRRRQGRSRAGEARGGEAAIEFVKKRYSKRAQKEADDGATTLGKLIANVHGTYDVIAGLQEWLERLASGGSGCQCLCSGH